MSAPLRVVSLLPSTTEIAAAIGLGDNLVGRSHECDYPPAVARLPVLTVSKLRHGLDSAQIEHDVQTIVQQGLSVYEVDASLLRALRPDVILTQSQCAVCAVTPGDLEQALADWTGTAPVLLSLAPDTLSDVWDDFARVGAATGREREAALAVEAITDQLEALRKQSQPASRPTVAAVEWLEPVMAAGNWVPELVEIAGGAPLFATAGQHSPWIEWDAVVAADPDVIVLMPCGYRIDQCARELHFMTGRPGFADLHAVRAGRVFIVDGQYFFNRPGPRLLESAQILAEAFGHIAEPKWEGEGWTRALR